MNWNNNSKREKIKLPRREYNRSTHHMITSVRRSRLARKLFINESFSLSEDVVDPSFVPIFQQQTNDKAQREQKETILWHRGYAMCACQYTTDIRILYFCCRFFFLGEVSLLWIPLSVEKKNATKWAIEGEYARQFFFSPLRLLRTSKSVNIVRPSFASGSGRF